GRNRVSLVPHVVVTEAPAGEPEVVAIARALTFASAVREQVPEVHAEHVARLAALAEAAAAELRRSAGSHLDPAVVAALLDVLDLAARGPALRVA
ncbi:MAG TPA: hypothetical protein VK631_17640, partial [Solirubrobacteraceae bacterium]|nr:hypothetical protein [Solirubrobacteraceae bacterium]